MTAGIETPPGAMAMDDRRPEPSHEGADLIAVLRTSDAGTLPVVKSTLDASGIPYLVQGDEGFGVLPAGPVAILVPADRADEARELLASTTPADPALEE